MAYNYITNRDSPNYTPSASVPSVYGMARVIEGITIHWWGDPSQNPQINGIVDYLCRANGNTSAHFVASGTNRQVYCIVDPANAAWHAGSTWGNARTIGIECDPRCRAEDIDVVAELVADIRSAYGDVPIYWHSYFSSTACPGTYRNFINTIDELSYKKVSAPVEWGKVTDAKPKTPAPAPAPAQTPTTTPTDKLFKVSLKGKQIGAYSTESSAWKVFNDSKADKITQSGKDITAALKAKYTTPSPTSVGDPNTGTPVVDKSDYEQTKARVAALETIVKSITDFLSSMFKGFNK